ncbi:hypothetical protein CRYUN_Cryun32bG0043500 [Craigia yunnanensis]
MDAEYDDSLLADEKLKAVEEENRKHRTLEDRMEVVNSQVEKVRALQAQRQRDMRCTILKRPFWKTSSKDVWGIGFLFIVQALQQMRRFYSKIKKYHHELQGFIKQEMRRNEFTAAFVNDELVFFLVCFRFDYLPYTEWLDAAVITVQLGQEIFHSR